ncbi:unnamed protein product [Peniophora sp. CBMAI 1063]|nr:unnamed protein product [Peniophora sp. CBMAI 1063]
MDDLDWLDWLDWLDSPSPLDTRLDRTDDIASLAKDPRLRARLGPIRILALDGPREYLIGRTPENDFVLSGKFAHYTSRKHGKLIWDGFQMFIVDLKSVNGTWVNQRRLADGEVRTLEDRDRVAFTPLPLDYRADHETEPLEFLQSQAGGPHALEFVYHAYKMDDLTDKLPPIIAAVRLSLAECDRIHRTMKSIRLPCADSSPATFTHDTSIKRTYRGSLDRNDRPQTPFYIPPLPIDFYPHMYTNKRLHHAVLITPGPEDADSVPADHPDIIWREGVRYKHVPGTRRPPSEMQQWSSFYNLPVGLHCDWPLFSSIEYGARPSVEEALPEHHTPRQDVYARYTYDDELIDGGGPGIVPEVTSALDLPGSSPITPSGDGFGASGDAHPDAMLDDSPSPNFGLSSPAAASPLSPTPSSPTHTRSKRYRSPDDVDEERPAKHAALPMTLAQNFGSSPSETRARPSRASPSLYPLNTASGLPDVLLPPASYSGLMDDETAIRHSPSLTHVAMVHPRTDEPVPSEIVPSRLRPPKKRQREVDPDEEREAKRLHMDTTTLPSDMLQPPAPSVPLQERDRTTVSGTLDTSTSSARRVDGHVPDPLVAPCDTHRASSATQPVPSSSAHSEKGSRAAKRKRDAEADEQDNDQIPIKKRRAVPIEVSRPLRRSLRVRVKAGMAPQHD